MKRNIAQSTDNFEGSDVVIGIVEICLDVSRGGIVEIRVGIVAAESIVGEVRDGGLGDDDRGERL